MSGILNLESALRTCKVDVGYQQRIQSDRFLNPKNLVCPVWNGLDAAGRVVCADSFYTKREGCNSAQDRVGVENIQRPQYMQYISDFVSGNNYNYNSGVPAVAGSKIAVEGYTTTTKVNSDIQKLKDKIVKDTKAVDKVNQKIVDQKMEDAKKAQAKAKAKAKEEEEKRKSELAAKDNAPKNVDKKPTPQDKKPTSAGKPKSKDGFQFLPKNGCGC